MQSKNYLGFDDMEPSVILGIMGVAVSLIGSIVTSAIMIGSMRADLHNVRTMMSQLSQQQNEHLQFHLQNSVKNSD